MKTVPNIREIVETERQLFIEEWCKKMGVSPRISDNFDRAAMEWARSSVKDESTPTKPFTAQDLMLSAENDKVCYDVFRTYTRLLRSSIDRLANRNAKANAEWHDDPESEDHADYHAPADEQYPRHVRDSTILQLVKKHLDIYSQEEANVKDQ